MTLQVLDCELSTEKESFLNPLSEKIFDFHQRYDLIDKSKLLHGQEVY